MGADDVVAGAADVVVAVVGVSLLTAVWVTLVVLMVVVGVVSFFPPISFYQVSLMNCSSTPNHTSCSSAVEGLYRSSIVWFFLTP